MAFTQSDLDAIRSAIAKGEKMVRFQDRSVEYRSIDELIAAEERIAAALANRGSKQTLIVGSSGKGF